MRRSQRVAGALAGLVALSVLSGCQVGERPTLGPAPADTEDANVVAVLAGLEPDTARAVRAEYRITAPTGAETTAVVEQDESGSSTMIVGDVRYVFDGAESSTCDATGACEPGIDAQPLSEYGISPEFPGAGAAARLRHDAAIRVGPTTADQETIAGEPATCVTVPIADTASVFCTLDGGPLARWRSTDVTVELLEVTAG